MISPPSPQATGARIKEDGEQQTGEDKEEAT